MSLLTYRIDATSKLLRARRSKDVASFKNMKWELHSEETAYRKLHLQFYKEIENVISMVKSVTISGGEAFQVTWDSMANAHLDTVEMVLRRESAVEIRLAQLEGFKIGIEEQNNQLHALSGQSAENVSRQLNSLAGKAKAASKLLSDISLNPKKYYDIAASFLNGQVKSKIPSVLANRIPSLPKTEEFFDFLLKNGYSSDEFLKSHNFFKDASKWFGVAQIGLTLTTVVFEALAQENKWAEVFAKAAFEAGTAATLGAVISGTAVASVINATLVAAGSTAEVPPVAAAIVAAGIVIVGAMAIATMFDLLVDLIFDLNDIPSSMRLSMTTSTYRRMNAGMTQSMTASMVSLPK